MKLELKDFQEKAVADLYDEISFAKEEITRRNRPQATILSAPTGSGKTVIMAALMEWILMGNEERGGESDAIFLWLSDQPELNRQSKGRIATASSRLREADLVIVEAGSFDQETFSAGKVYFLNTQKLGKESNLVSKGDGRNFTIWETIQNTSRRQPNRFYVIIDEAHRGMQLNQRDQTQARTIMQKFILGSSGEIEAIPLIIGISATPARFEQLLQQTERAMPRTRRPVNVSPDEVRASGLLKDKLILYHPEDDQPADWSLLAEAARQWRQMRDAWQAYCLEHGLAPVHPALVIQVEDGNDREKFSRTPLVQLVQELERAIGPIDNSELVHSFQEDKTIDLGGGREIRKVNASDLQDESEARFILFKMSLTTGWDCPRAEVMMSFRKAQDATLIAQLVGRMVRTPLARRVEEREFLNTVVLYLPHYDAEGLQRVANYLRGDHPETMPPTEIVVGREQVSLHLQADEGLRAALARVPTQRPGGVRKRSNVRRLVQLGRRLHLDGLEKDAWQRAKAFVIAQLTAEGDRLQREDLTFAQKIKSKNQITIRPFVIEQGTWKALPGEQQQIAVSAANVEELFKRAGRQLGEGLEIEYWKAHKQKATSSEVKLELYLILQDPQAWDNVERECEKVIGDLFSRYNPKIAHLGNRDHYQEIREVAKKRAAACLYLPEQIQVSRQQYEAEYGKHLYTREDGGFSTKLNEWEDQIIREEIAKLEVVGWLRNYSRKRWALSVAYEDGGQEAATYPDFLVIRRNKDGDYITDLLEPHRPDLDDNWKKAKGLAQFASEYGLEFGRIELIRVERNGRIRRLNINREENRREVLKITRNEDLDRLFEYLA